MSAPSSLPVAELRRYGGLEDTNAYYDFNSGLYALTVLTGPYFGVKYMTEAKAQSFWASEAMAGAGIR